MGTQSWSATFLVVEQLGATALGSSCSPPFVCARHCIIKAIDDGFKWGGRCSSEESFESYLLSSTVSLTV